MAKLLDPFRFLMISPAGWMNKHHLQVIDYLFAENRVLREELGDRRLRLAARWRAAISSRARRWPSVREMRPAILLTTSSPAPDSASRTRLDTAQRWISPIRRRNGVIVKP